MATINIESEFLEKHLLKANHDYAMVYLCALNYTSSGNDAPGAEAMGKILGMKTSDVNDAISYWKAEGFDIFGGKTSFVPNTADKSVCTPGEIASFASRDRELASLYEEAQKIMGKTLSTADIQTVFWLYDTVGLTAPVIILAMTYAVRQGKGRMRYIEKTAIAWAEKGFTTVPEVMEYIAACEELTSYEGRLKRMFSLNRNFLHMEREIIIRWKNEYKPSDELVYRAYELCIENTNKFSMKYINAIIKSWFEKGYKTVEDTLQDKSEKKGEPAAVNSKSFKNFTQRTDVDYEKIERDALLRKINQSNGDDDV